MERVKYMSMVSISFQHLHSTFSNIRLFSIMMNYCCAPDRVHIKVSNGENIPGSLYTLESPDCSSKLSIVVKIIFDFADQISFRYLDASAACIEQTG